jgi:hypothetical protein
VTVSREGRWAVTAAGKYDHKKLGACEIETGIVKSFEGYARYFTCNDIILRGRHATGEWVSIFCSAHIEFGDWQTRASGWSVEEC